MSAAPISAADNEVPPPILAALARAGWPAAAWWWEQAMADGLAAAMDGDCAMACDRFACGRDHAAAGLPAEDLRRVTAAANLAIMQGDVAAISALAAAWIAGEPWLGTLRPHVRARSSLFHMRLERRNPGGYDGLFARRNRQLWDEGLGRLTCAVDVEPVAVVAGRALARWRTARQSIGFVDQRKLLAAASLLLG